MLKSCPTSSSRSHGAIRESAIWQNFKNSVSCAVVVALAPLESQASQTTGCGQRNSNCPTFDCSIRCAFTSAGDWKLLPSCALSVQHGVLIFSQNARSATTLHTDSHEGMHMQVSCCVFLDSSVCKQSTHLTQNEATKVYDTHSGPKDLTHPHSCGAILIASWELVPLKS